MQQELQILSYNVFGSPFHGKRIFRSLLRTKVRQRFRIIAQEVQKKDFDVLLFQEVYTYPHFFLLRKQLSNYPYVLSFRGRYGPKGGLVIFSKYCLEEASYIDFTNRGVLWNKSLTGPLTQKGMILTKLANSSIWLINTHLTQDSDQNWTLKSKYAPFIQSQLTQLGKLVKKLKGENKTVILTGDLNIVAASVLFQDFMQETKLFDAFSDAEEAVYHDWYSEAQKVGRIDYVLYSDESLKVLEKDYQFTERYTLGDGSSSYLSDHIALFVKFGLSI